MAQWQLAPLAEGGAPSPPPTPPPPAWQAAPLAKPSTGGVPGQGLSGLNESIAGFIGFPVDAVNSALGGMGDLFNRATGADVRLSSPEPVMGSEYWKKVMGSPVPGTEKLVPDGGARMIMPPPERFADSDNSEEAKAARAEAFARTAGRGGGTALMTGLTMGAGAIPSLVMAAGGGLGEATAGALTHDNPWAMAAGSLAAGSPAMAVERWMAGRAAERAAMSSAPGVEDIFKAGRTKYGEAEAAGVAADRAETSALRDRMRELATKKGAIDPEGNVNTKYTDIAEVLRQMDVYAKNTMTPSQMQGVRSAFQDAAAAGGKQGEVGTAMLRAFDEFTTGLAPQLREGDALFAQAHRAKDIETAITLANDAAASGKKTLDRALLDEFGKLRDKITRGELTGLTEDQVAAIRDVASTGSLRGLARFVGTAYPKSIGGFAIKEALPLLAGNFYGGTTGALGAAATTTALGYGGQKVADALAKTLAQRASAKARGAVMPPPTSANASVAAALLAQQVMDARRLEEMRKSTDPRRFEGP